MPICGCTATVTAWLARLPQRAWYDVKSCGLTPTYCQTPFVVVRTVATCAYDACPSGCAQIETCWFTCPVVTCP